MINISDRAWKMVPNPSKDFLKKVRSEEELEDAQESAIWKQKVGVEIKKLVIKAFQELRSVKAETWHSLMFKRQIQLGETGQLDMSHSDRKWDSRLEKGQMMEYCLCSKLLLNCGTGEPRKYLKNGNYMVSFPWQWYFGYTWKCGPYIYRK